ncbi:MAG: NitT/TauT family transport system substrate-binding protein [Alphaproteobacteria bacterium]|nr:NitT/TauT family transport system substrate-binding protein [Alphaproteobacteria bacterium]
MAKKKIKVFYRAPSHVPLWKVMEAGGFNKKHGFEFELGSLEDKRKRATEGLLTGEIDIVSGNHHSLYARRGLHNEPFVHIGQVNNQWNQHWMVARDGIDTVADLRGKRISMNKRAGHPGLNLWLYLKQQDLEDGKDVTIVDGDKKGVERVRHVMAGAFDATFIGSVDQLRARQLGARVIDVPTFPMIEGVTLTTTTKYVNSHPEEVDALLRSLVDALHYFKTNKQGTLGLINDTCRGLLRMQSDDELETFYDECAKIFEKKPYPRPEAIQNVFQLGVHDTPENADFNPLVMWDMHHLRVIDDSGYIDKLYQ